MARRPYLTDRHWRIRLLEPMAVDDLLIPKGTVLVGGTRVEGERMGILIETVEYRGTLFPVELEVYDADGQQGILVPNSMEYDAAREIAAGMGTSIGSSINISTDAGAQDCLGCGQGGDTGYVTICGQEDAHGENHPEGRTPAVAAFS